MSDDFSIGVLPRGTFPEVCVFTGAFGPGEVHKITSNLSEWKRNDSIVYSSDIEGTRYSSIDRDFRSSESLQIFPDQSTRDRIHFLFEQANLKYGFDLGDFTEYEYLQYEESRGGHFSWHQDCFSNESRMVRKLSMSIQLSYDDRYEGCDLQFQREDESVTENDIRLRGTAVVFPSIYYHQVTPCTKGTRKTLVVWRHGPQWR